MSTHGRRGSRVLGSFALFAAAISLAGCGSTRLYSETRDKQGQAATKAWSEADIAPLFAAERESRAEQLTLELSTADKRIAAMQDLEARQLAAGSLPTLRSAIEMRFDALVGTRDAEHRERQEALIQRFFDRDEELKPMELERVRQSLILAGLSAPSLSCGDFVPSRSNRLIEWAKSTPAQGLLARSGVAQLELACRAIAAKKAYQAEARQQMTGTLLGETLQQAARDAALLTEAKRAAADAKRDFELAAADYQLAVKDFEHGATSKEKVAEKAAVLEARLADLEGVGTAFGVKALSEERLKQISDVLASWKDGKGAGADDTKVQVALKSFPTLADDLAALQYAQRGSSLAPLVLRKGVQDSRQRSADAEVEYLVRRTELLSELARRRLEEAHSLVLARQRLAELEPLHAPEGEVQVPLTDNWGGFKDANRRLLVVEAVDRYLFAVGPQQALSERARRALTALQLEHSSALSELNAGVWTGLISVSVQQSAEWAALGIKASDITNIVTALGVIGIAHGTNK